MGDWKDTILGFCFLVEDADDTDGRLGWSLEGCQINIVFLKCCDEEFKGTLGCTVKLLSLRT